MKPFERFVVTGPVFGEPKHSFQPFLHPDQLACSEIPARTFATLTEAKDEARVLHQQFGDTFAIWHRDSRRDADIIGRWGPGGFVSLHPDYK